MVKDDHNIHLNSLDHPSKSYTPHALSDEEIWSDKDLDYRGWIVMPNAEHVQAGNGACRCFRYRLVFGIDLSDPGNVVKHSGGNADYMICVSRYYVCYVCMIIFITLP